MPAKILEEGERCCNDGIGGMRLPFFPSNIIIKEVQTLELSKSSGFYTMLPPFLHASPLLPPCFPPASPLLPHLLPPILQAKFSNVLNMFLR